MVKLLQRYHDDHGFYPVRLDDLVPDYAPALPLPVTGDRSWEYTYRGDTSFELAFPGPKGGAYYYAPDFQPRWVLIRAD